MLCDQETRVHSQPALPELLIKAVFSSQLSCLLITAILPPPPKDETLLRLEKEFPSQSFDLWQCTQILDQI